MPMEVKKKDEWNNVKKLIALRWRNGRFVRELLAFFGIGLAIELFVFVSIWMSGGEHVDSWVNIEKYGSVENTFLIVYIAHILLRMGSVLGEDGVSMYPGTVKTRYISRILSDWLVLVAFVAANTLLNLLVTGGDMVMAKVTGNYGKVLIIGNLGWTIVLTLLGILAIYSVVLFLQTLYERVGALAFWTGALVLFAYLLVEISTPLCIVRACIGIVHHFIFGGENMLARILLVIFVVFAVCMLLSFFMVRGIRSWKREKAYNGFIICFVVLFVAGLFIGTSFLETTDAGEDFISSSTLEEQIEAGNYLVEDSVQNFDIDQKVKRKLNRSMENMEDNYSIQWVSLEDAKEAGIVSEKLSLQPNEICIRTVVKNCEVQGISLTEGFLNAKLTMEGGSYQVKEPLKVVLQNRYLSLFQNVFLSDEEQENLARLRNDNLGNFLGYFVIYNKEDVVDSEVPMSFYVGNALDEFTSELEE